MVEEVGVVTSVDGLTARVNVPKKSACEGCTAGVCMTGEQSMEIVALNKAGAKTGQKVKVSIRSIVYMKSAMVVYGIPALALVLGAVFGKEVMAGFFKGTDPDVLSAVFGFGFLGLSFVVVRIWANRKANKTESGPVIEEILD
jgi:sigma-E factor negative regulatory protein RseC